MPFAQKSKLPVFRGAIFDLDGTLLDSMGIWSRIDEDFLGRRGIPVPPDYMDELAALGFRPAAEYTIKRFGFSESPEEIMTEWTAMAVEAYSTGVSLKPNGREYLLYLKECGVKLAVATASQEELFVPALRHNGVYELFDAVTTLKEVSRGKGWPDIYWKAAQKLGLRPEECAVFEDIYAGVKGAKEGGFFTIGVDDPFSGYEKEKILATSDLYITNFSELME